VQVALCGLHKALQARDDEPPAWWVGAVCRNAIVDWLRATGAGVVFRRRSGSAASFTVPVASLALSHDDSGRARWEPACDGPESSTDTREQVETMLAGLPRREAEALRLYYGLDGPPLSQLEVGRRFRRSEAWASITIKTALGRLRRFR